MPFSLTSRLSPATKFSLSPPTIFSSTLFAETLKSCIALFALAEASLIFFVVTASKPTVYAVLFSPASASSTVIPLPATTVAPLALIFSLPLVLSTSIPAMFVPASILSFKASAVTPFDVWLITDFNASSLTLNVNLELPLVVVVWSIFK